MCFPMNINFLRIPLYLLVKYQDSDTMVEDVVDDMASLKPHYSSVEWNNILTSLQWATKNADYHYQQLLPELRLANKTIFNALQTVYARLTTNLLESTLSYSHDRARILNR